MSSIADVLVKGVSIGCESEIEQLHAKLAGHFDAVRASKHERPNYVFEHGLEQNDLDGLIAATRSCLGSHRIAGGWWSPRPLPLLVAATEVGYAYRGTGTDFWPIFAERYGETSNDDRAALSSLFSRAAHEFGLACPADTPWNRAFCHIAWPVLHAILPIELHRPLARVLRDLRVQLDAAQSDAALVEPVRNRARLSAGSRLIGWLEDNRTAAAIIRQFLEPTREHGIEASALARIAADLARDETASTALQEARKRQKAMEAPARRTRRRTVEIEPKWAPLVLRPLDQGCSLALKIPQMEQGARDSARSAVSSMRWRALLWGQGRPIPGRNVFSDYPIPLSLDVLPPPETSLFGDISTLPLSEEAKDHLSSLRVRTTPPLLFSDASGDDDAFQLFSGNLTDSGCYIVLIGTDNRPPSSAENLGRVAGLRAYRVDAALPEAADWLAQLGFAVRHSTRFSWLGSPEVEQHRPTRRFRRGSLLAFEICNGEGRCEAQLVGPDGSQSTITGNGRIIGAFTADRAGSYSIQYGAGDTMPFEVVDDLDHTPLITVDIDAGTGAIGDLADGQVTLRFDGSATVQEAGVELRLLCDGREVERVSGVLPDTPCRLSGGDAVWERLLSTETLERLLAARTAELCVSVRGLLEASFSFEQTLAPFGWKTSAGGKLTAFDEAGELVLFAATAQTPLRVACPEEVQDERDITLFRAGHDSPLQFGGYCVGPRSWRMSDALPIERPQRLLRQFENGKTDMTDGRSVVDALIAWSAASVDHPVTHYRRGQVVHRLEQWMVEQLCGPGWAQRERSLAHNRKKSFAQAFLGACGQLGVGYADVPLSREQSALLDRILLRLIEERALALSFETCRDAIDDESASAFDELFNNAYDLLADDIESVGDICPYDPSEDIDVGETSDRWEAALHHAASESALLDLVDLMRPLNAADGLSAADFETMLPDDVIDFLQDWISRNQPQHLARSWNRDLVESAYWLFAKPAVASRLSWRAAAERLLADRFSARAIRYAALRSAEIRAAA